MAAIARFTSIEDPKGSCFAIAPVPLLVVVMTGANVVMWPSSACCIAMLSTATPHADFAATPSAIRALLQLEQLVDEARDH